MVNPIQYQFIVSESRIYRPTTVGKSTKCPLALVCKKLLITALVFVFVLLQSSVSFAATADKTEPLKGSARAINILSDEMEYLRDEERIVATGNVVIIVENDGTRVEAKKVIYDRLNEQIVSEGAVKITKDGAIMEGDYAKFNLLTDSVLIGSPDTSISEIKISAKKARVNSDDLQMSDGKITMNKEGMVLALSTGSMNRGKQANRVLQSRPDVKTRLKYNIKAKEILVTDSPTNKIVTLKNATIRINRFKIAKVPVMKLSTKQEAGFITVKKSERTGFPTLKMVATEAETSKIETSLPEFGYKPGLGAYVGYGHVFDFKKGATLKTVPIFTWGGNGEHGDIGGGGMARYMSATNETEIFYTTMTRKILIEGQQRVFTPNTVFLYGANSYMDNGFFGLQKPAYLFELVDTRSLVKSHNLDFTLRSTAGLIESDEANYSTGRFQLQGGLRNVDPFWRYKDYLLVGAGMDAHLGVYATGNSYGVARIGPEIGSTLGPLELWAAYYQGGIGGETPFIFDRYYYGKSNLVYKAILKVCSKLALGYVTSLNLTKDSWENELITENQIFVWVGPEDLRFKLGYDIKRERSVFAIDMLIGSEDSAIDFEKLKVKQKL